jgi:MFS family permease
VTATSAQLRRALIALCVTEITSWGTLYYSLPAMTAPLSRSTGWPVTVITGAFSAGLVVSAIAGIGVGRLLDRFGPRVVMSTGSVAGTVSLLAIGAAPSVPWFIAAWILAGLAQSALLYPPAFAALTRWYGPRRVRALTAVSLVAGLASTVFAPLTAFAVSRAGWRATDMILAGILLVVTLPLHIGLLTAPWPAASAGDSAGEAVPSAGVVRDVLRRPSFTALAVAMVLGAFGLYAATVDLPALLTSGGTSNGVAALALGLVGVGQVCGRLGYGQLSRRTTATARTCAILGVGAVTVAGLGLATPVIPAVLAVTILAGAARGNYTLIQATAVSDRWGTRMFGTINGIFLAPVTAAIALAPVGGTLLMEWTGVPLEVLLLLAGVVAAGAVIALAARPSREYSLAGDRQSRVDSSR